MPRVDCSFASPIKPNKGFSNFPKREPTIDDYISLYKWTAMLEGASLLRPDLSDGVAAYSHFLNGGGKKRTFSYERYVMNDLSGKITLRNAILDAQNAAIELWINNGEPEKFSLSGPIIPCGTNNPKYQFIRKAFPYPATENWQKAIGAHVIWVSASVTVTKPGPVIKEPIFKMNFTLHAEDQYNFNPGMTDIASGIPDDENGNFVVVGFAQGYLNTSTLKRSFSWKGFDLGVAKMGIPKISIATRPNKKR